jgi:DNA invertase Pin-like site-specific DNA recombinase
VVDQIRTILADALKRKAFIPLEYSFIDLGVRGAKSDRPGLNSLRQCIESKAIQVAYFFSTNRLFRRTYRSLQFVEEQIVEQGIRGIFVKSSVDTAEGTRWRGLLDIHAMMDEFVVSMTVDHIRAAQEGLLEKRLVFGTISLGYTGIPLDCQTTRRGRPRRTLAKDPIAADWVRRVFSMVRCCSLTLRSKHKYDRAAAGVSGSNRIPLSWRSAAAGDAEWMSGKSRTRLAPVLTGGSSWMSDRSVLGA